MLAASYSGERMAPRPNKVRAKPSLRILNISNLGESDMRKIMSVMAVVAMLGFVFANESLAQRGMGQKGGSGWGPGTPYAKMYNPQTVETVTGEVVSVDKITPMKGMSYGIHVLLKTAKETISVHLGPGWYIENQDVKISPKDKIEVKGSRVSFEAKPALIAAEVKKGDKVLMLRDANGFPVWSSSKRK